MRVFYWIQLRWLTFIYHHWNIFKSLLFSICPMNFEDALSQLVLFPRARKKKDHSRFLFRWDILTKLVRSRWQDIWAIFASLWTETKSIQGPWELDQYLVILASRLVNNAYVMIAFQEIGKVQVILSWYPFLCKGPKYPIQFHLKCHTIIGFRTGTCTC